LKKFIGKVSPVLPDKLVPPNLYLSFSKQYEQFNQLVIETVYGI
jgi:hypothetical protein